MVIDNTITFFILTCHFSHSSPTFMIIKYHNNIKQGRGIHAQRYRKDVSLPAKYMFPGIELREDITIRELSFTGIQFESPKPHKILKDDLLEIKFKLDNRLDSAIRKLARVIWVKDRTIGADFVETNLYEEELKSYLEIFE